MSRTGGGSQRCASVLADGGQMVHSHPNYSVPYEPHFSVPLVPFRPALTARILADRIAESDVWRSLNWVTANQVRRWCSTNNLEIEFARGVLADALERVGSDPLFGQRHKGAVQHVATFLSRVGMTRALGHLPARFSTPMEYSIHATTPRSTGH